MTALYSRDDAAGDPQKRRLCGNLTVQHAVTILILTLHPVFGLGVDV